MFNHITSLSEALLLIPGALVASWVARRVIRTLTRRAVRRAQASRGGWRVRLDRLDDDGRSDDRKLQRADATARMIGHLVTVLIFSLAALAGLELLGVDPVFAISSAGFIGLAIALSAQDFVKDFLGGVRALLEDRYAVGDEVSLRVGGNEVVGIVDLVGTASVRLRTTEGATWHAGHHAIESVTNLSQLPSVSDIAINTDDWSLTDSRGAGARLTDSSNDHGLTGLVFMPDIEAHEEDADTVLVRVKANRPLDTAESDIVRSKLLSD